MPDNLVGQNQLQLMSAFMYHVISETAKAVAVAAAATSLSAGPGAPAALQPSPLQQKTQLKESAEVSQSLI